MGVLEASGIWGVIFEPAESGPFNAHVLDDTPPILVNTDMFNALSARPETLTIAGGEAGFGPIAVNISLAEVRPRFIPLCVRGDIGAGVGHRAVGIQQQLGLKSNERRRSEMQSR